MMICKSRWRIKRTLVRKIGVKALCKRSHSKKGAGKCEAKPQESKEKCVPGGGRAQAKALRLGVCWACVRDGKEEKVGQKL